MKRHTGFIKLHRCMLDWEWWDDKNVRILWISLLLNANWIKGGWKGSCIERGQLWTSLPSLERETGLSTQEIRTALDKLSSTGEITVKSTSRGRLITIVNYDVYQKTPIKRSSRLTGTIIAGKQTIQHQYKKNNNIKT